MTGLQPLLSAHKDEDSRIERLMIEISARFINLPSDQVDREIENAQRQICECLGFDRSTLWQQPAQQPDALVLTHIYQPPEAPEPPPCAEAQRLFPWSQQQLRTGRTIVLSNLDDLPSEAARDKESWQFFGTQSTLIIPLSIGGKGLGALSFASLGAPREWPKTLVRRLELFAQIFANAISRARADQMLRDSEERLRLAVDAAGAGLWIWHLDTNSVWVAGRTRELFQFGADQDLRFEDFLGLIDPQDRLNVRQGVARAVETGASFQLEFRIVLADQSLHWIAWRGSAGRGRRNEIESVMGVAVEVTERKRAEAELRQTLDEVQRLRDQLQQQNVNLQHEVKLLHGHTRIIGNSLALKRVLVQAEQVAPTHSTVLLLGETGTGKELIASEIHELSPRRNHVMVRVNCAAIPASLLESELFGREKGAYTGALSKQMGRFEMANGSTLFLDEVGDLPPEIQVKLLRVLQEKTIERLGSPKPIAVDVRIIAATNRELERAVREGRFREDLYYRLNVFPITVPPLRERREDIPVLVSALVEEFAAQFGKAIESIDKRSMETLQRHHWPGNIRELRNVIERAMIVAAGPKLCIDLPAETAAAANASMALRDADQQHICRVLEITNWRIRGRNGAAEILGLKPSTLESRMTKLGIRRPAKTPPK